MADNREGGSAMEELPDEILFQLLSLLPPEDVAACGGTCTRLRAVAEDAHLWRSLCAQRFPIVYAAVRFLYLSEHIDGYCMVGSSVHTRVFLGVWYRHRHTAETDVPDRDLSVGWKDYYVKKVVADRIFRAGEFECVELESDTDRRQVCLVAGSRVGRRRGAETKGSGGGEDALAHVCLDLVAAFGAVGKVRKKTWKGMKGVAVWLLANYTLMRVS